MALSASLTAVQYYTQLDPYFYAVDNRPLADLAARDVQLANEIEAAPLRIFHVRDTKANNTAGDTFTSGAYQTSTLNDVVYNGISGASLGSNLVTLPAGTYRVDATLANGVLSRAALYNTTNSTFLLKGITNQPGTGLPIAGPYTFVKGIFVLAATSAIALQLRVATTGAAVAANFGESEIYADMLLTKIA
jgi:hypothetical protein